MGELIKFETAKLAKEKGFDIDVNHFISQYGKDGGIVFSESVDYDNYNHKNWNNDNRVNLFSAPTQSELQKWLRDKYRIHVSANPWKDEIPNSIEGFQVLYEGNIIDVNNDWRTVCDFSYYKSYEECLEELFLEALKLIPEKEIIY